MKTNPELDPSFSDASLWRDEADILRQLLLSCDLTEEKKWGKPCYSVGGSNICIIQRMKGFLALLFFKGALLDDPDKVLEPQGPNSHQGYRMRFTDGEDVIRQADSLKALVATAIKVDSAGLKAEPRMDPKYPVELIQAFEANPEFRAAFEQLTPGRRRGYTLHFTSAKQSDTRTARIERNRLRVMNGKGLQERG